MHKEVSTREDVPREYVDQNQNQNQNQAIVGFEFHCSFESCAGSLRGNPRRLRGDPQPPGAVASMYGSCIFIGHDYILPTRRVDNGNIPTLITTAASWLVTGVGWRAKSTSGYGTVVVGHLKKARLSQLMDSSSRTSVFAASYSRTSLDLVSSQKRGDTLCKH